MLVTQSGITTLVNLLQPENAYDPILVTGYPPSADGIVNTPVVDEDTAVLDDAPPPSEAFPFDTVYVQVMPLTLAVLAKDWHAQINITAPIQHTIASFL